MERDRTTFLATAIVVGTGALWGFYWLPVRRLAEISLPGAWGTLAIVAAAAILLAPAAYTNRRRLARASRLAIASVALGGAAFALYSIGFVYGRVAIIILLFFLTPVWSVVIGRYVMGWRTPRLRMLAIAIGIAGLAVMLGADGDFPLPRGTGEWLALASGMLWSLATTGIRAKSDLGAPEAAFVFALGAAAAALILAPVLEPWPGKAAVQSAGSAIALIFATGGLWWGLSMTALIWATARLEPARVGILLMTEVLVGALSAALLAGEYLGAMELIGGALVLLAGVLEVLPLRPVKSAKPTRRSD
ncbi:MAG: DMT family transporter [Alphaproteobacteria bacterium]|nr:DMT family transporter [Alphaproteobacteria bacterium]NNF24505.1 DMT family transporter [Paracoccaceae bacterium]